jgi:hypothetical protein
MTSQDNTQHRRQISMYWTGFPGSEHATDHETTETVHFAELVKFGFIVRAARMLPRNYSTDLDEI